MHLSREGESLLWRRSSRAALVIVLAFLAFQLLALGQQSATEDQVKAAYLFNFAKLSEWPRTALPDGQSPLVIGVSGGDAEFLDVLRAVVAGKFIGPHPLVAKSVSSEAEMKQCHIVFLRASEKKHAQAAIESLARSGVLFVGEDNSFLRQGGMINLVREHGSVRFEVNPTRSTVPRYISVRKSYRWPKQTTVLPTRRHRTRHRQLRELADWSTGLPQIIRRSRNG